MTRTRLAVLAVLLLMLSSGVRRRAVTHPPSDFPEARPDIYSVGRGKSLVVTSANGVLSNDSDPGGKTLTAIVVTSVAHGTLALNASGAFTYSNDGSAATSDSFTYKASNGINESVAATVTITITQNPPVAVDDNYTLQATSLTIVSPGVLVNDTTNAANIVSYGANGTEQTTIGDPALTLNGNTITMNVDGSFTYTPRSGFAGSDVFKYKLQNSAGSSVGTVTIAVQPPQPDFFVTSPGFFYQISGLSGQNPVVTLKRGRTYIFSINTDLSHPFIILGAPAGSVTNNNISNGTITFSVPTAAQNYDYQCSLHGFGNKINTTP